MASKIERRLSAVFSADVQGYSRLMGDDEEATILTLTAFRNVLANAIAANQGRVVDSPGDNLLAEFGSAVDAVRCAVAVQADLESENSALTDHRKMRFRIGINVGDVIVESERIYGDGVNIAARIESIAAGGGVCISSTVHDQVEGKLPLEFRDLGEQMFKNIARPIRVFEVLNGHTASGSEASTQSSDLHHVAADKPSIAVLPFENRSGDAEQEYFSDGMTEDLITDLSKISGLFVIARNSAFTYKGTNTPPEAVGAALGVRYVVEGSVRKAGNRVRISAQLVDAKTSFQMWAERYDRQLDDIFEVQDEVIHEIVAALAVNLTTGEEARVGAAPTHNIDAYDAFVRGREEFARRNKASNAQARILFTRAIELDENYAAAYAFLGRTYLTDMVNQWNTDPAMIDIGIEYAQKSLERDPTEPSAHETLSIGLLGKRDHDAAVNAAQNAVRYDPNAADYYVTLGEILSFAGKATEAVGYIERAMRLNPHYTPNYIWALGHAHRLLQNYDTAITQFNRVVARNPDHLVAHLSLTACYVETDQMTLANAEAAEVMRINPDFSAQVSFQRSPYKDDEESKLQYQSLLAAGLV